MTFGNLTALWQDDLRRLLAYSSIANAGYMLLGLAVALAAGGPSANWDGMQGLWFFLAVYGLATIVAFASLEHLGKISPLPPGEGPGVRAAPTAVSPLPLGEGPGVRAVPAAVSPLPPGEGQGVRAGSTEGSHRAPRQLDREPSTGWPGSGAPGLPSRPCSRSAC